MRLSIKSMPIFIMAVSVLVSACETPGINNFQTIDQSDHPRPTLPSKQAALQNTQSIVAERLLASAPDYYVPSIKAV